MISRAQVVAAGRALIGSPFQHQGRSVNGIDCAGVVIYVAKQLSLSSFDATAYRKLPAGVGREKIEDICRREMTQVDFSAVAAGDIALFLIGKRPRHLAIIGDYQEGGLSLIHAYEPTGKVTEVRFDEGWRSLLFETYSLPGVD